jgi:glutamate carboxypeptidase
MKNLIKSITCIFTLFAASNAFAAANEQVRALAKKEQPALIETLKQLTAIESGSRERAELDKIADVLAQRLRDLGAAVELIEPNEADTVRLSDTPEKIGKMVKGTFTGTGTKKILLMAYMDTVYPKGMAAGQPFKIEGDRVYGLGIADARGGLATILHTLSILKQMNYRDYGTLTVFFNGDEEIGSPGARNQHTRNGSEHDAVMSFEGGGSPERDGVRLATSGRALALLSVRGRASHAGSAPERGVNALDELSHQILQMRDLSNPKVGLKVNWTLARAGIVSNMIPPGAQATGDVRVERVADFDGIEQTLKERIKKKLLPDSSVELVFERQFPPLEPTPKSRALSAHAQTIYQEIGRKLVVMETAPGGATDAAFASLKAAGPVVEGFGLRGFGSHTTNAEYILVSSIEPRLYLATRMIMDISSGKAPLK